MLRDDPRTAFSHSQKGIPFRTCPYNSILSNIMDDLRFVGRVHFLLAQKNRGRNFTCLSAKQLIPKNRIFRVTYPKPLTCHGNNSGSFPIDFSNCLFKTHSC